MPPQLISLKPKLTDQPTLKSSTSLVPSPVNSEKTSPTIARKDALPVKHQIASEIVDDDRNIEFTPSYSRREPTDTRRTRRGYSARQTTGRSRPPRVSKAFESKFHALERKQKNLVEQTKLEGQLEYLTVSLSSSGHYWITVEGCGKPFIRQAFATPEFCFEAALNIEDTFDVLQVIELRPGETIERIEEMVAVYLDRERVAKCWG